MRNGYRIFWQRLVLSVMKLLTKRLIGMPRATQLRRGEQFGMLGYHVCRIAGLKPYRVARRNLAMVYGDTLSEAERDNLLRRVFQHWGKFAIDFLYIPNLPKEKRVAMVEAVHGWEEHVAEWFAAGKGGVVLSGHFGNSELMAGWFAAQGANLLVVARDPNDTELSEYIRDLRQKMGFRVVNKGGSVKTLLSHLRGNGWLGVMPDQNSGDLFVPFFGILCGTVAGPAVMALKMNTPIIAASCRLKENGFYDITVYPPIEVESTGDADADHKRIMTQVNRVLEQMITDAPEQWLWLHDRWKSAFEEKNRVHWPSESEFQLAERRRAGKLIHEA